MFFSSRMSPGNLAGLCRRLAIALTAGVDARTIWAREARQARPWAARRRLATISQAVNQGRGVADSLADCGDFFPTLFRDMVDVGEQSGQQGEVFAQLADYYEGQVRRRRMFLAAIAWPMLQLFAAVAVIGFLIWILGAIGRSTGVTIDILGWGLVGERGLAIYLVGVAIAAGLLALLIRAASRGMLWTKPLQRVVLRLPVLGSALETLALARLAWSMYLTLNAGMDLRRALRLSLRSAGNARFADRLGQIDAAIAAGNSIHEAFCQAGCFRPDFLDALEVGEHSGTLVESMDRLSKQYQEQAQAALATLTMLAGFAVWAIVAAIIVVLIFRLFSFYLGAINDAMPK
ncbi:MAG: type II secretion system F family protein [Thermoguttaceae bacterium]|jgi:type IV pilus assembly protein PilC